MKHLHKNLILLLACLSQFMIIVDLTIVNVALPAIQQELTMSQSSLQWIVIAYGLLFGGLLLLGGRLSDLLGRRKILLTGLAIFSLASLTAGLADSSAMLIASRAAQGLGAALIAPTAFSIIAATFKEGKERNTALGIYGAVGGASASVGVLASGLLTDGPGWSWIFYINIPVGAILIALAFKYLPQDRPAVKGEHTFDAKSALLATSGLLLLVYALNRGVDYGWLADSTLGLFGAAIALLAAFVWTEWRSRAPLVPLEALKNRAMVSADIIALFAFGSFFAFIFLTTLLMQQQLGYSATKTGLTWLVTSMGAFIVAGLTGAKLIDKIGPKRLLIGAMICTVFAALWLSRIPASPSFVSDMLPAFLAAGVGVGIIGPTINIAAMAGASTKTFGAVAGLLETMRELGGVFVIAAVSTILVASGAGALVDFHVAYWVIAAAATIGGLTAFVMRKVSAKRNN
jgi:EmrB/QacA subfamily drug resistance transporter